MPVPRSPPPQPKVAANMLTGQAAGFCLTEISKMTQRAEAIKIEMKWQFKHMGSSLGPTNSGPSLPYTCPELPKTQKVILQLRTSLNWLAEGQGAQPADVFSTGN